MLFTGFLAGHLDHSGYGTGRPLNSCHHRPIGHLLSALSIAILLHWSGSPSAELRRRTGISFSNGREWIRIGPGHLPWSSDWCQSADRSDQVVRLPSFLFIPKSSCWVVGKTSIHTSWKRRIRFNRRMHCLTLVACWATVPPELDRLRLDLCNSLRKQCLLLTVLFSYKRIHL